MPKSLQGKSPNKISNCTCSLAFQFNDQNSRRTDQIRKDSSFQLVPLYLQRLSERRTETFMAIAHGN